MTVADYAFYAFASVTIAAGLLVTVAKNPVHSVLWLILTFLSSAGLFVMLGAEFVAMLLIIVYVGAVAVLFLFVVMMLDIDFAELKGEMSRYMPLALLVGLVILMQLVLGVGACTWASGSQVWTGHIGIFTAKLAKKARNSRVCKPPVMVSPRTAMGSDEKSKAISVGISVVPAAKYMAIIATSISTEPRKV